MLSQVFFKKNTNLCRQNIEEIRIQLYLHILLGVLRTASGTYIPGVDSVVDSSDRISHARANICALLHDDSSIRERGITARHLGYRSRNCGGDGRRFR